MVETAGAGQARAMGPEGAALKAWMEKELASRLHMMDAKLDRLSILLMGVGASPDASPRGRRATPFVELKLKRHEAPGGDGEDGTSRRGHHPEIPVPGAGPEKPPRGRRGSGAAPPVEVKRQEAPAPAGQPDGEDGPSGRGHQLELPVPGGGGGGGGPQADGRAALAQASPTSCASEAGRSVGEESQPDSPGSRRHAVAKLKSSGSADSGATRQVAFQDLLADELGEHDYEDDEPPADMPSRRSSGVSQSRRKEGTPLRVISEVDVAAGRCDADDDATVSDRRSSCQSIVAMRMSTKDFYNETSEDVSTVSYSGGALGHYCGLVGESYAIHPQVWWYRVWNYLFMMLVIFSTFFTPVRYGFNPDEEGVIGHLDNTIDAIFAMDMILTCNVALVTKEGLVTERRRIFWSYVLSHRFLIDFFATVPFDMIWSTVMGSGFGGQDDYVYGALGLLRLLRVNRILELFREMQKSTKFNLLSVVVLKFVLFILLITHTAGCILYGLARTNDFDPGTWVYEYDPNLPDEPAANQYMHALYWAVGTFKAGPAHASLSPRSTTEMLVACLTMLLNICMNVYLVSSMAALLTTADTRIYAHRGRLRQLAEFGDRYSLPAQLQNQLRSYLWFKFNTDQDLEQTVLSSFPEVYQARINHILYAKFIAGMSLFQGCVPAFLSQLYGALKPSLHMAQHQVVNTGEPSRQLQIIAKGEVDMFYKGDLFEVRAAGVTITEVPFICDVDQQFTVRTRVLCRILSVDRRTWQEMCHLYPVDLGLVTANLLNFCRQRAAESEVESPAEMAYEALSHIVESHMVHLNEANVGSLNFAAQRGDLKEMQRLLVVTSAAASDYDKRSPLHIAAASGQVEAIKLLLERKADINSVDHFGRTPLLEACRSRQHGAAQTLFANNAELGFSSKLTLAGQLRMEDMDVESLATSQETGFYDGASEGVEAGELCQAASDAEQLWYLRALLKFGANPNAGDYDSRTALHVACAEGNKPAVKLLLSRSDVDTDTYDNFGRTPLMEAVRHGHEACARLLHAKGAHHGFSVDIKNNENANAVHAGGELCQAAFANQLAYLGCLTSYCGLDVDVVDYDKRTALMLACAEGNWDAAISLVQHRADVNRGDRWGHTALTEARDHGHPDLAKVLKDMAAERHNPRRASGQEATASDGPTLSSKTDLS